MGNPSRKTGKYFTCKVCGKEFYRTPGQIKNGATKTCSRACVGIAHSGKGNPFWGKTHTEKTRRKISGSRKGKALGNQNAKGYRHTDEAKKRIANASKKLWKENRDMMLDSLPKGWKSANFKPPELRRHRKQFTPRQRREWASTVCAYCETAKHLVLDHIIPIFDGGINMKENAQTLCRGCNLWKIKHIDLPRYHAALAIQGDH